MSPSIVLSDTIQTILQRYPAAAPVLHALHIDTCCGGGRTLEAAALGAAIAPNELLAAVQAAADQTTTESQSCTFG